MPRTYDLISSNTLSSTSSSVSFTGISSVFTDLVLSVSASGSSAGLDVRLRFNSDTGTNYSYTYLSGYTNATSGRSSSATYIQATNFVGLGGTTAESNTLRLDINKANNTSAHKQIIMRNHTIRHIDAYREVMLFSGQYRSLSAISNIEIYVPSGAFAVGSIFSLYGIQAA
jgi:hypothetical protein